VLLYNYHNINFGLFLLSFLFFLGFLLFFYYLIFNTKARNQLYTILSKNDISVLRFLWGIPSHSRFFRLIGLLLIPKVKIQREIYVPLDNKKKVRCILFSDISYEEILKKKKLILHYHGGGFSTMRPEDHQSYLREWAKNTKIPILSVDYSLAPEYPFPNGFNDCFETYKWCLTHFLPYINKELNNNSKKKKNNKDDDKNNKDDDNNNNDDNLKIVITGDSAGGNFTLVVTLRIIAEKLSLPAGIMPTYPAIDIDGALVKKYRHKENKISTRILFENELVLSKKIIGVFSGIYVNEDKLDKDSKEYYYNPIVAPPELLKKFPKTIINVGDLDPLFDDALIMTDMLKQAGVDVKLHVFKGLSHAYLNYATMCAEGRLTITKTSKWLQKLF